MCSFKLLSHFMTDHNMIDEIYMEELFKNNHSDDFNSTYGE